VRRRVWIPLHRMMEIFHILPLTAGVILFLLLATDGQLREIYLSYLEDLKDLTDLKADQIASIAASFAAAAAGLALISMAFHEAHYRLSTMRINVIYSCFSNPGGRSMLRSLQRMAASALVLLPWLGLVTGLVGARNYLAESYDRLKAANIDPSSLDAMQHLPAARAWTIIVSAIVLGLAVSIFLDRYLRNAILQSATIVLIPFAVFVLFLLLTELRLEKLSYFQLAASALGFALTSAAYYAAYYRLYTKKDFIYTLRYQDTGINLRRHRRRLALFLWALCPWVVIALYFAIAPRLAQIDGEQPATVISSPWLDALQNLPAASRWSMIPLAMIWVIAMGLLVAMLLDRFRESKVLRRTTVVLIASLMAAAAVVSRCDVDDIVWLYRLVGPLGSLALVLLFLFSTFALVAYLSQKSGFPALTLIILAIVISAIFPIPIQMTVTALTILCAIFVVMALMSRRWAGAIVATFLALPGVITWIEESRLVAVMPNQATNDHALEELFKKWLDHRTKRDAQSYRSKTPVFIIAVEGGGIYAAAAASLFLAKLQDCNPSFARHVFAISGVSGGAIGATVFQTLDRPAVATRPHDPSNPTRANVSSARTSASSATDDCGQIVTNQPLALMVSRIMQDDHFSPVVGAIFPELFGATAGRAEVLAGSFKHSVRAQDRDAAQELEKHFVDYWSETSHTPALVLNTTWVETGFRVAFAPFPLHAIDETLYSFSDENMPGEGKISLIEAAVVSARFPGMLPPYSILMNASKGDLRWNFVDGGYSDNSGASTALALYRTVKKAAADRNAEIRILLLTSSNPQPNLVAISGTAFRDTLAPIAAIMKVRAGLGNQAVARVCDYFYGNITCKDKASEPNAPLKIVGIADQTYGLPLGWKLSRTTFDVVSWLLGHPSHCSDNGAIEVTQDNVAPREQGNLQLNEKTVWSNSCVLKSVLNFLSRNQSGQP
jgi:hypothetical protein